MADIEFNSRINARRVAVSFLALILAPISNAAIAQSSGGPTTRPLLDELNRETQTLFSQIAPSIVRVQLPLPTNLTMSPDDPLAKWAPRMDPDSFRELSEIQHRQPGTLYGTAEIRPTTVPSAMQPETRPSHVIVLQLDRFSPNGIGIVLDEANHLLVPRYVDKDACQYPIPVSLGNGQWATAKFVASDAKSDLTLLQMSPSVKATPATIAPNKPDVGTLLLVLSLNPAANRLTVWEGWEPDVSALVNVDGSIAGFTKAGRYLSAAACLPLAGDLIRDGVVHRAFLGVVIDTVGPEDPDRQIYPALGATPALRIQQVIPSTAAERAGLLQNDLILALAGESVGDVQSFAAAIANRHGNTEITVLRQGQVHLVDVDLEAE